MPGVPSATRWLRSPAAMAPAVSVIRRTGRTPRWITHQTTRPSTPSTARRDDQDDDHELAHRLVHVVERQGEHQRAAGRAPAATRMR